MQTVLIVVHLMIVLALVGVVLLQRSEGGGLGIGGGSGFMSARGAANALTRTTAILAAAFFATSLALSILARYGDRPADVLDKVEQGAPGGGVLDKLGGQPTAPAEPAKPAEPAAPTSDPAKPAEAAAPIIAPVAEPVMPVTPVEPAAPTVDTAKPAEPAASSVEPAKPAEPVAPTSESAKPAAEPAKPAQP